MAQQADDRAAETPPPAQRGSSPAPPQRSRFGLSPRWLVFVLALLALNVFIASRTMGPESRVRVPYSPFFLQQIQGAADIALIDSPRQLADTTVAGKPVAVREQHHIGAKT